MHDISQPSSCLFFSSFTYKVTKCEVADMVLELNKNALRIRLFTSFPMEFDDLTFLCYTGCIKKVGKSEITLCFANRLNVQCFLLK